MDFSFRSILLFLIIIFPGIVFRKFFYQGEFTKQFYSRPWLLSSLYSIVPGTFIHLFLLISIHLGYGLHKIDLKPLERFYFFFKNQKLNLHLIDVNFIGLIVCYYLIIILLAWLFATISWKFVRGLKLDSKYKVFRFQNYWNYYFKGDLKYFKEFNNIINGNILLARADILVGNDGQEKPSLYTGDLRQYTIKKDSSLENVYLTNTKLFTGERDANNLAIKKDIPGDCFIIPAKNILNINLNYISDNSRQRIDFLPFISVIWLIFIIYLTVSSAEIFISESIIRTIFKKIYYVFYSFLVLAFISTILNPKITYDQAFINSCEATLLNNTGTGLGALESRYNIEIEKKKKKEKNKNGQYGTIFILVIMSIIIYFAF